MQAFQRMHSRLLETLRDAKHEAQRLNKAAGHTVFNPAVMDCINEGIEDLESVTESESEERPRFNDESLI